jgi:Xaa-Pro aminopeptidase
MKLKQFQKELAKNNIDLALYFSLDMDKANPYLVYFTGYNGIGVLAIPKNSKPFLMVPLMEYERAKKNSKIRVIAMKKKKRLFELLTYELKKRKIRVKTIGIDRSSTSLSLKKLINKNFKKKRYKDTYEMFENLRKIKTKEEIEIIKKSCKICSDIFKRCFKNLKNFKTEAEVKAFLISETYKNGCEPSFEPIVASGKASSQAHYSNNVKLQKGFCIIDYGVKYKGYCSDITRTVYLGKPSKKEKEMYALLLSVQKAAIRKIRSGMKASELNKFVIERLGKYAGNFTHGLGHGIGVKIHELPNLIELSKDKLEDNMAFTVEPGIYFEDRFGIRIEDDILIENNKVSVLTDVSKELTVIS